jgi:hypothetical protein
MLTDDWIFILVVFPMIMLIWVMLFVIVDNEIFGGRMKRKIEKKLKLKDEV